MKQFLLKIFTWWQGQTIGTQFFTWRKGSHVGTDQFGNQYYKADKIKPFGERRWVIYKGEADASSIPSGWHGWMHKRTDILPDEAGYQPKEWQKDHQPNLTGTAGAYYPPGSMRSNEQRSKAIGDYEAWSPTD